MLPCRDWADEFADEMAFSRSSVLPKPLEPIRRPRGVAHRRGNRAVAEVMLDSSSVLAVRVAKQLSFRALMASRMKQRQGAAERRMRIDELLPATGLDPFANRPCGKLSGGMKQKVSLCCALMPRHGRRQGHCARRAEGDSRASKEDIARRRLHCPSPAGKACRAPGVRPRTASESYSCAAPFGPAMLVTQGRVGM
jgi:hypothetical protein